jgi:hypothetical protein
MEEQQAVKQSSKQQCCDRRPADAPYLLIEPPQGGSRICLKKDRFWLDSAYCFVFASQLLVCHILAPSVHPLFRMVAAFIGYSAAST